MLNCLENYIQSDIHGKFMRAILRLIFAKLAKNSNTGTTLVGLIHEIQCAVMSFAIGGGLATPVFIFIASLLKTVDIYPDTGAKSSTPEAYLPISYLQCGKNPPSHFYYQCTVLYIQSFSFLLDTSLCCFSSFFCKKQAFYARMSIMDIVVHIFQTSM